MKQEMLRRKYAKWLTGDFVNTLYSGLFNNSNVLLFYIFQKDMPIQIKKQLESTEVLDRKVMLISSLHLN